MRIKRFAAKDLPGVVAKIKEEFGLNAVILSQRENPETGETEVTAGVREEDLAPIKGAASQPIAPGPGPVPGPGHSGPSPGKGGAIGASAAAKRYGSSGAGYAPEALSGENQPSGPAGDDKIPNKTGQTSARVAATDESQPPDFSEYLEEAETVPLEEVLGGPFAATKGKAAVLQSAPHLVPQSAPQPAPRPGRGAGLGGRAGGTLAARDLKPAGALSPRKTPSAAAGIASYKRSEEKVLESVGTAALEKSLADLRGEMEERHLELKNLLLDLAHRQSLSEKWRDRGELIHLYRKLLDTGLESDLSRSYVEMAAESREAWGGDLLDSLKKSVLPSVKTLPPERDKGRLLALTGPSGGGKTHCIMKLSGLYKQKGLKVALISLDTLKLGASEQLGRFARIMGLGLKVCQNREEFREAKELFSDADKVLIDTSARDILAPSPQKDVRGLLFESGVSFFLSLPAVMKSEDLIAFYEAAKGPFLTGVILTKLGETLNLGNVFNFVKQSGPIFAYFSLGLKSPEDFIAADPEKLISLWLRKIY
jgi:flagellar biosynthesis protein FlhF